MRGRGSSRLCVFAAQDTNWNNVQGVLSSTPTWTELLESSVSKKKNHECTRAAGRWRYTRAEPASKSPPYLIGMATGGHGGFLNSNWIPWPPFLSLPSVRRTVHSTILSRPESRWFILSGLRFNDVGGMTQDGLMFLFCTIVEIM